MRRIASLRSFFVVSFAPWAQSPGKLTGIVVDRALAALLRATPRLLDKTGSEFRNSLTDSQGRFQFERVATGSYRVEVH